MFPNAREPDSQEQTILKNKYLVDINQTDIDILNWSGAGEIPAEKLLLYYSKNKLKNSTEIQTVPSKEVELFIQTHFDVESLYLHTALNYDHNDKAYVFEPVENLVGVELFPKYIYETEDTLILYSTLEHSAVPNGDEYYILTISKDNKDFKYLSNEVVIKPFE